MDELLDELPCELELEFVLLDDDVADATVEDEEFTLELELLDWLEAEDVLRLLLELLDRLELEDEDEEDESA